MSEYPNHFEQRQLSRKDLNEEVREDAYLRQLALHNIRNAHHEILTNSYDGEQNNDGKATTNLGPKDDRCEIFDAKKQGRPKFKKQFYMINFSGCKDHDLLSNLPRDTSLYLTQE